MIRFTASLLLFSWVAVSCNFLVSPATPPPSNLPDIFEIPWNDRSIFKEGLVPSAQPALDELEGASVYHIELNIEESLFDVMGTLHVQYTNNEDIALDEVHFRLFPNILGGKMQIANLRVGELTTWPRYALENSLMIVPLAQPMEPGDSIIIHMDFSVTVPQSLDSNYGVLAYADDVLALAHAYPMIAVYDEEGWNAEIPPQTGDVVFADASFYLLRISAPKDVVLVTSGREISRTEIEHVQILNVASGPARDFYLAASPDYEETSETFNGVTVRSFAPRYFDDGSRAAVSIAARAGDLQCALWGVSIHRTGHRRDADPRARNRISRHRCDHIMDVRWKQNQSLL